MERENRILTNTDFMNGTIKKGDVLTWHIFSIGRYVSKSYIIGEFDRVGDKKNTIVFSYAVDENRNIYTDTSFMIFWGARENYLSYATEFEEDTLDDILEKYYEEDLKS